jgi:ribosomal protein L18
MAMSESNLSNAIMSELKGAGFKESERNLALAAAIAKAVVAEVKNATVTTAVASGSSAGSYTAVVS